MHYQSYHATYDITGSEVQVALSVVPSPNNTELRVSMPQDAKDIIVEGSVPQMLNDVDRKAVRFESLTQAVNISYQTKAYIESANEKFFILDVEDIDALDTKITVLLPPKASLKYGINEDKKSYIPMSGRISTDGKRIALDWERKDLESNNAIFIIYETYGAFPAWLMAVPLTLLGVLAALFIGQKKASNGKPQAITANLFEEEKIIVEALLKSKQPVWQKQLEIKTGLTKVKLSRKIRSLEQKGIVEKIPYGNSNKVRIKA